MNTFLQFLTNKKQSKMEQQTSSTPVVITSYSQPHVLQLRMKESKLSHGDRVTANVSPVRLETNFGKTVMYFCPIQDIKVLNKIEAGDGGSLPEEAIIEGFQVPSNLNPGLYTLEKAQLFSNGTLQVIATPETKFAEFK